MSDDDTDTRAVACANCDWQGTIDTGRPLDGDWYTRLDPGGEVPACECPECGSLAYLVCIAPNAEMQQAADAAQITREAIATLMSMAEARRSTILDLYDIPDGITALTTDDEMTVLFAKHGLNHVDLNWHPAEADIEYAKEYRNLCRAIAVLTPQPTVGDVLADLAAHFAGKN